jgi:hypothetical protein
MLRVLAFLALALYVLPVQTYAQTDKAQQGSKGDQPSPPVAPVAIKQNGGPKLQPEHHEHVDSDVRVISTPAKDRYDRAAFWANIALVVVGFLGIGVAIGTLRKIKTQTDEMKLQRIAMQKSLAAMETQAGHMAAQLEEMKQSREVESKILILQYRPKILVRGARVSDLNFSDSNEPMRGEVRFTAVNTGGTGALITGGYAKMLCADASGGNFQFLEGGEELIGEFALQPGQETEFRRIMFTGAINSPEWVDGLRDAKPGSGKYLYLTGVIHYRDELEIPRQTSFSRNYDTKERKFVPSRNTDEEYAD